MIVDAYSMDHMRFEWLDSNALEINEDLELSQFSLIDVRRETIIKNYTTGKFELFMST